MKKKKRASRKLMMDRAQNKRVYAMMQAQASQDAFMKMMLAAGFGGAQTGRF